MSKKSKKTIKKINTFFIILMATISFGYLLYKSSFNKNIIDNYAECIYNTKELTLNDIYKIRDNNGLHFKIYDYTSGKIVSLSPNFSQTEINFQIKDETGGIKEVSVYTPSISIIDVKNKKIGEVRKFSNKDFFIYQSHGGTMFNKTKTSINSFNGCQIYILQYASRYNATYDVLILEDE